MSSHRPNVSAYKRKKGSRHNATLREDDEDAIDTVTHQEIEPAATRTGRRVKRVKVPFLMNESSNIESSSVSAHSMPTPDIENNFNTNILEDSPMGEPISEGAHTKVRDILAVPLSFAIY